MLLGLTIKYMVRGIEQLRAKDEPGAKEVNGDIILYFAVMSVLSNCGSLLAGLYFSGKRRDSRRPNADNSDAVAVPLSSRASLQRLVSCDKVNDERGDGSDADGEGGDDDDEVEDEDEEAAVAAGKGRKEASSERGEDKAGGMCDMTRSPVVFFAFTAVLGDSVRGLVFLAEAAIVMSSRGKRQGHGEDGGNDSNDRDAADESNGGGDDDYASIVDDETGGIDDSGSSIPVNESAASTRVDGATSIVVCSVVIMITLVGLRSWHLQAKQAIAKGRRERLQKRRQGTLAAGAVGPAAGAAAAVEVGRGVSADSSIGFTEVELRNDALFEENPLVGEESAGDQWSGF